MMVLDIQSNVTEHFYKVIADPIISDNVMVPQSSYWKYLDSKEDM